MTGQRVPELPDPRPRLEEFLRQAAANPTPTRPDDIERLRARITTPSATPDGIVAAIDAGHVGQVTILCDTCGVEDTADYTGETREDRFAAARRHLAEQKGWKITDGQDLCPACGKAQNQTMDDLYPDGRGYHQAHEPYLRAVADALTGAGIRVMEWHAEPNDPRDGAIRVNLFGLDYDEVWLGWQEERGWTVLLIEERQGREPSRWVYRIDAGNVFSPESVVRAFGEHMGITVDPRPDSFPDLDFPRHEYDDDDVAFEMALHRYANGQRGGCPVCGLGSLPLVDGVLQDHTTPAGGPAGLCAGSGRSPR